MTKPKVKIQLNVKVDSLVTVTATQWLLDAAKESGVDITDMEDVADFLENLIVSQGLTADDISPALVNQKFGDSIQEIEILGARVGKA